MSVTEVPNMFISPRLQVLIAAMTLFLSMFLLTASSPIPIPSIHFARDQYNIALAKWNSLNVAKYEMTLRDESGCRFKSVVQVEAKRIGERYVETVTQFEGLGSATIDNPDCLYATNSSGFTVGGMFYFLEDYVQHPFLWTADWDSGDVHFSADYHPTLGYPNLIAFRNGSYTRTITVESLKILSLRR